MPVPVELRHALTRLVTAGSGTAFVLLDDGGRITYASPGALAPLGRDDATAVGLHWSDLIRVEPPLAVDMSDPGSLLPALEGLGLAAAPRRSEGHLGEGVVSLRAGNGRTRWARLSVLDGRADPEVRGLLVVGRDVTAERLAAEATAAVGALPLRAAVDRVAAVLARVVDFDRLALSGIDGDAVRLLAVSGSDLPAGLIGSERPLGEETLAELRRTGWQVVTDTGDPEHGDPRTAAVGPGSYVSTVVRLAGQSVGLMTLFSGRPGRFRPAHGPLLAEAAAGTGVALLLLARLAQEQAAASALLDRTANLLRQATSDPLTGLANRSHLREVLSAALAAQGPGAELGVGLLFCDLDRFKVVNDALGHHVGDVLLQQVADRLRTQAPAGALVARLGGDEFVVLVPSGATSQGLLDLGVALQAAVAAPVQVDHHVLRVDLSAGAVLAGAADTPDEVLQHADTAMYRAKFGGRRRVALWTRQVGEAARARFDLERELALALTLDVDDDAGITVVYQPVADLRSGRWHGVEALARWQHPQLGEVPPSTFVPLAEEVGLSARLTAIVGRHAVAALAAWSALPAARGLRLSVNVSGRDLVESTVLAELRAGLRAAGLPSDLLMIELTETAIAQASVEAVAELQRLRDEGARLALDDFGTGFSSLVHLRALPVTTVKIDRGFVSGPVSGGGGGLADPALVRAVIGLAVSLELEVVAEGVETREQADALLALGCHQGQGWLLGRPVTARAVLDRFAAGS